MLTTDQKAGQLYKHFLNVSDTRDTRDFYEEAIQSSFCIRPDQLLMYGDEIPRGSNPDTVAMIRELKDGEYYNWQKDETTVIHVVQYHENYPLKKIDDGTDNAFKLVDDDGNLIQNVIPFNYYRDLYNYDLRTNTGNKIYFGVGEWVLDTFSGVLKFYGDVPPGVDHNNPPTISFYQYVGGTGFRQDTFGYDGVIVPIKNWHISAGTYIIDGTNLDSDGNEITLEDQISDNANAIQDGYTGIFGFDGADKNEGIAYSLQKIISLTYASSLDNVKGYDDSAKSDIGTLLTRKKATTDLNTITITFCSENVSVVDEHSLVVSDNTVSFDGGLSKVISGPTKLDDGNGNFIIVEASDTVIESGTYKLNAIEDVTTGIMLYWSKSERDYIPFINKEEDDYNFGFPVVAANGRIPPSVSIGAISLNDYTDSITPEYYGPRNYTVTIALEGGDQVKSADYTVKNTSGYYLDDILKRVISDYSDSDGNLNFIGSIFLRAGTYKLSGNRLNLSDFTKLNLIGEDKATTIISGGLNIETEMLGTLTISNLTVNGKISFNSSMMTLYLNEIIGTILNSEKSSNSLFIKNCSFDQTVITDSLVDSSLSDESSDNIEGSENFEGSSSIEGSENYESSENSENTEDIEDSSLKIYNHIVGCIIGYASSNTGHTFYDGDTLGTLKLYDVEQDVVKACFIQKVISKPSSMILTGSTVFTYEDTCFTEIPHMRHFPIYSQNSSRCLEYATFDNPFRINYSQSDNLISIALDDEYLYINDDGELSCNLNAGSIIVDRSQLKRNSNYEGDDPFTAIPNKNLQEALNDLYSTKADLNPNGKLPLEELPDSVAYGGLLYVGTWSFEYVDDVNGLASENYYVDGGAYPKYSDAIKNLTVDQTQDEGIEPGWFWIVASSKKDDDKPAAKQTAMAQTIKDTDGNVVYSDDGLVFTAGDWVIWNGTNFEKLDRAYQDAAYAVLPIYTTGEHFCWSWRDSENDKKWGLGALALGGETIAESFDMVNQELRNLWVKHPAILGNIELTPYYDNYRTLNYYEIGTSGVSKKLLTAYDLHKDERTKEFRVKTPQTDPKWKSGVFVGDSCTITASVDGSLTRVEYAPTSAETTENNVHISKAFDPFDDEISGSNYWKAVYVDFGGSDFTEGSHKFMLSMEDIQPLNSYTKDAISSTPVFGIDTVDKYDFTVDEFKATIDDTLITINGSDITSAETEGLCSGIPNITDTITIRLGFIVKSAIDCVNADRVFLQIVDELNGITTNIPESNMSFSIDEETNLYTIRVKDLQIDVPVTTVTDEQKFTINVYDVYGNKKQISEFLSTNIRFSPELSEKERVFSGTGIFPTVDTERKTTCGYPFDSSKNLKEDYKTELMKSSRNLSDGSVIQDYGWPDGANNSYSKYVDYNNTETCDTVTDEGYEGDYRWVTFAKVWNGTDYELATLSENSGFTLDINVASDVKSLFTTDVYTMSTNLNELVVMAKLVDYSLQGDCGLTKWFNCNAPYDGFAEVGTTDGQNAMYAGSSTALSKRITFGTSTYTGTLIFRVGIKKGSKLRVENLSIRDLI